jgi:tetratricopeptide (TPR) repeat protein
VKTLLTCMILYVVLLATAGPLAAQMAHALNQTGLDHFNQAFYEATPRQERTKAAEEYRLAEQSFQAAISSQPDWVEPYLHLARTYFVQKKYRQAAEIYQKALTLAPQRREVYLPWASALEKAGDYQGAITVLQTLRTQETYEHAIAKLDEFIRQLQARSQAAPANKKGSRLP